MKILAMFVSLFFVCSSAYAKNIYFDKTTNEVLFMSDEKETVVINDKNIGFITVKNIGDLEGQLSDYKISGKNVVLNNKKISDRAVVVEKQLAEDEKYKSYRKSAEDKLKVLGLTDDEVNVLLGKD